MKLIVETANELVSSEPPKFLFANDYETQKTIILDEEDEEQTLDCIASGIPVPTITWVLTYEVGKYLCKPACNDLFKWLHNY